jgi:outer membrane biosynthesis protein TonB
MSVIRPKAGTTMILAGVPIIVAVAFSLTPHNSQSSQAIATEAVGRHVAVSDQEPAANAQANRDRSTASGSSVVLVGWSGESQDPYDERQKPTHNRPTYTKPTHTKPTHTKPTHEKPTHTKTKPPTTKPPTTKPPETTTPATVEPTRTELPITSGRDITFALAGAGLLVIGVLLLLIRRMARDH